MSSSVRRYLHAFGPSALLGLASFLIALKLRNTALTPMTTPVVEALVWLPLAGVTLASCMAFFAAIRLWRWEAGHGPACPHCGGIQGMVRPGRYGRSDYRACFDCGRYAPADH
jgi:succinate dehydrogenase/fumarate reductase cytochrome b subunit